MKKPALKKSPNEKDKISDIVSEIVEENEKKDEIEDLKKPDEAEKQTPAAEEEKEIDTESAEEETIEEETRRYSFYEKVMGEKPPEKRQETEEAKKERSVNAKLFLLGAFVFVLTILISSLVWLSILNKDILVNKLGQKVTTITPTQTPPTPTPIVFIRDEWTFEVLNGSNTPGIAAKGAEKVKALGYKVSKVGNADGSVDATQVFISANATEGQIKAILEDLKKDFGEVAVGGTLEDSKNQVRLILAN